MRTILILGLAAFSASPALAECRLAYDFSELHLQHFSDAQLAQVTGALMSASPQTAIDQAKAGGYDQQSAYGASMGQADASGKAAAQSFQSAAQLSGDDGSIARYRANGLPADFTCGGAAAAAVCAGFIALWGKVAAEQTAEAITCDW